MAEVSYSLKNGVNRTNNPTIGGVFAYGSYTSAGVFTLFPDYEYEDGDPFVSEPFDATQPLVWKGATQYPHLGFENLSPNSAITPQPFPSFGIYLHPFVDAGIRKDVGVRVTIPFGGNIAIASIIQRADLVCGDNVGYRIMRNGVAIQARQFIASSSTATTINTPVNTFAAGDIIDFIVDAGSQDNYYCDDVALEITLNYQYTKIPTPTIDNGTIYCDTTQISGITAYVSEGTIASIYDGTTLLYSTSVILDNVLYRGSFEFTGLDFINSLGKHLCIVLEKSGDTNSDPIIFTIQDGGCEETGLPIPVVTEVDFCNATCDFQRTMTGKAVVHSGNSLIFNNGEIAIFENPYIYGNPIIASAIAMGGAWSVSSANFKEGKQYVAFLLNYAGYGNLEAEITTISCQEECHIINKFKGKVNGVVNGIIRVFLSPIDEFEIPIVVGIVRDGKFDLKTDLLLPEIDYILMVTKIN
jgi:hypothetical protein